MSIQLTSQIPTQRITTFNIATFGEIIFGQSIFGYGITYGSNLVNSHIESRVELVSTLEEIL